jgi:uncharacterized membrane protein
MIVLILGIVIFLGAHTLPMLRDAREGWVARLGAGGYKGLFSVASVIGFVLIVWGFSLYRAQGWVQVWQPPIWTRHLTITLMWFAFVSLAAMGKGPSRIRGWLRHPMLVAIKIWALAHLLANGDLGGMILFGSFLAWAVFDRISVKRRGDLGAARVAGFTSGDGIILIAGTVAYVAMIFLHPYLIGVSVLAM